MNVHHLGTLTPDLARGLTATGIIMEQDASMRPTAKKVLPLSCLFDDCESLGFKRIQPPPARFLQDAEISDFYGNSVTFVTKKPVTLSFSLEDYKSSMFGRVQVPPANFFQDEEISGFYGNRAAAMKHQNTNGISKKSQPLSFMLDDNQSNEFERRNKSYASFFQDSEISGFYNKTTATDCHADDDTVHDNTVLADDNNSAPGKTFARLAEMKTKVKNTLTARIRRPSSEVVNIVATQTTVEIGGEEVMVNVLPEGTLPGADREETEAVYTPDELTYAFYENITENRQQLFRAIYCLGDMLIGEELEGDVDDWMSYIEKSDEEVRAWRKKCYKSNDIFEKTGRIMGYDDTKYRRFRLALKKFSLKKFFGRLCPSWK